MFLGWTSILPRKNAKMSRLATAGSGYSSDRWGPTYGGISTCSASWHTCSLFTPNVCNSIVSFKNSGIPSAIATSSCKLMLIFFCHISPVKSTIVYRSDLVIYILLYLVFSYLPWGGSKRRNHEKRRGYGRGHRTDSKTEIPKRLDWWLL